MDMEGELKIYKSTDSGDANKITHFFIIAQILEDKCSCDASCKFVIIISQWSVRRS